jgi:1,4-dihydroxy-2-naphthoyl-CoA synthase
LEEYESFFEIDVVEIALNRPERRNALGKQLLAEVNKFRKTTFSYFIYFFLVGCNNR